MIDRAFAWAKKNSTPTNKRCRTNDVHGEDEIKIVLSDTFELDNIDLDETTRSGSVTVEEGMHLLGSQFYSLFYPVKLKSLSLLCQLLSRTQTVLFSSPSCLQRMSSMLPMRKGLMRGPTCPSA